MKFTQREIAALWIAEGGNPSLADMASAVAMAESSGDSKAGNYCCHGLFAINVEVGNASMKCALDAVCNTKTAIKMQKEDGWAPWETVTNGAYKQFMGGSGFDPKKGFGEKPTKVRSKDGTFVSFSPGDILGEAKHIIGKIINPAETVGELAGSGVASGVASAIGEVFGIQGLGDIAKVIEGLAELLLTREGWIRMAKIIGGVIMFLWGLRIVIRESTGTDPVQAATHAAAQGAAVAATVK